MSMCWVMSLFLDIEIPVLFLKSASEMSRLLSPISLQIPTMNLEKQEIHRSKLDQYN